MSKKDIKNWISENSRDLIFLEALAIWTKAIEYSSSKQALSILRNLGGTLKGRYNDHKVKSTINRIGKFIQEFFPDGLNESNISTIRKNLNRHGLDNLMDSVKNACSNDGKLKFTLTILAQHLENKDLWGLDLTDANIEELGTAIGQKSLEYSFPELVERGIFYNIPDPSSPSEARYIIPPHVALFLYEMVDVPYEAEIVCPHCSTKFLDNEELTAHINECEERPREPEKKIICSDCGLSFEDEKSLKKHLKEQEDLRKAAQSDVKEITSPPFPYCKNLECGASFVVRPEQRRQAEEIMTSILKTAKATIKLQDRLINSSTFRLLRSIPTNVELTILTHLTKERSIERNRQKYDAIMADLNWFVDHGIKVRIAHLDDKYALHDRVLISEIAAWGFSNSIHSLGGSKPVLISYIPSSQKQYLEGVFDGFIEQARILTMTDIDDLRNNVDVAWSRQSWKHAEQYTESKEYLHLKSIEQTLHTKIKDILTSLFSGDDWWTQGIPLKTRKKCADRWEEASCKGDRYHYTDFIDLATIVKSNWKEFSKHPSFKLWKGNRKKMESDLVSLNDIRKKVMHPIRSSLLTDGEKKLLEDLDSKIAGS